MTPNSTYGSPMLGANQTISVGAASQASATPLPAETRVVRLLATTDCFVRINPGGTSAAASSADTPLAAYTPEYFGANPGDVVYVIQMTASGTLYATPFA